MKVLMLQDYHGVEGSVDRQIDILSSFPRESKITKVLHEPLCSNVGPVETGTVDLRDYDPQGFWDRIALERHWGPSEPYRKFYGFLYGEERQERPLKLAPLDYDLHLRNELAQAFKDMLLEHDRRNYTYASQEFDRLKRILSFDREHYFCSLVDDTKYEAEVDTVVVITHPFHIDRCVSYFRDTQNYNVEIAKIDDKLAKQFSKEEDELQLRYAEEKKVLEMVTPPLVPIVSLAWDTVKSIVD
jgi:hypothetical protein